MACRDLGGPPKAGRQGALTIVKMPRAERRLLSFVVCALLTLASLTVPPHDAAAQSNSKPPVAKSNQPTANSAPAAANAVVPSAENTVILIRSTLLSLNDALLTGNYTVLRDLAAPSFRERNTAGRLYQIFSGLAAKGVDLSAVAIRAPKLPQAPSIDVNKRLHISGHFPVQPGQINFELVFEAVSGRWQLFGLSVKQVQSVSDASTSQTSTVPADKKTMAPERKAGQRK